MIINSKIAFFSELYPFFIENKKLFAPDDVILEHLVLLVFLIFEEMKGEQSKYYHYIKSLPFNTDYIVF